MDISYFPINKGKCYCFMSWNITFLYSPQASDTQITVHQEEGKATIVWLIMARVLGCQFLRLYVFFSSDLQIASASLNISDFRESLSEYIKEMAVLAKYHSV